MKERKRAKVVLLLSSLILLFLIILLVIQDIENRPVTISERRTYQEQLMKEKEERENQ